MPLTNSRTLKASYAEHFDGDTCDIGPYTSLVIQEEGGIFLTDGMERYPIDTHTATILLDRYMEYLEGLDVTFSETRQQHHDKAIYRDLPSADGSER